MFARHQYIGRDVTIFTEAVSVGELLIAFATCDVFSGAEFLVFNFHYLGVGEQLLPMG